MLLNHRQPVRPAEEADAARPQHPLHLARQGRLVADVLINLRADNDIKAAIGEGQAVTAAKRKARALLIRRGGGAVLSRQAHCRAVYIHPHQALEIGRQRRTDDAASTTHVQAGIVPQVGAHEILQDGQDLTGFAGAVVASVSIKGRTHRFNLPPAPSGWQPLPARTSLPGCGPRWPN